MAIVPTSVVDFWFGLPEVVRRPIRTFVQAFVGIASLVVIAVLADFQAGDANLAESLNVLKVGGISAVTAGAVSVASLIQNAIEDARGAQR